MSATAFGERRPAVAIVGGGLLGLTAAHRLAGAGAAVTVFERSRTLGGLAASTRLGGHRVDRFYHVILPTDDRVLGLLAELGLPDAVRFSRTRVGFYHDGALASMSSGMELLRFPGLSFGARLRLAAFAVRCQLTRRHDALDETPLTDWLRRTCGEELWRRIWRPLLASKFDGHFGDLPATYVWARSRRMAGARDAAARELMGAIDGGYQTLVDALVDAIRERGGEVLASTPVQQVTWTGDRVTGVVTPRGLEEFDAVVTTQLRPEADELLPGDLAARLAPDPCRYLGVICLVLRTRRSVSPFYALNITDRSIPLTTVVETTHVVDAERAGGTLLYVARYVDPASVELARTDAEIRTDYTAHLRQMFPALREEDVLAAQVARARRAEPVHPLGAPRRRLPVSPVPGLAMASSADVYPELVNGQAVIGVAERLVAALLPQLTHPTPAPHWSHA